MARKKVIDLNADTTIKFGNPKRTEGALPKGSTFDGYYIGGKEVESSMGPSMLHVFQTDEGNVGVWGSAQLNSKLKGLNGFHVWLKFVDEIKVPKGTMKVFEVEYDDEDTIDVQGTQVNFKPNAEEPEESEGEESEESEGEESEGEDDTEVEAEAEDDAPPVQAPPRANKPASAPSRPRAAAASPEQQARVNAILNKKK